VAAQSQRGSLSRDAILIAALDLVDREGTEKFSMRRLGAELGVDPMALYRHVPNKAAVFDGIMELIWGAIDLDAIEAEPDRDWQSRLSAVMHALRDTLLQHPHAVSILGTRPLAGPELFTLVERVLAILVEGGLRADADSAELLNVCVNFTVGHVLAEAGEPAGGEADEHSSLSLTAAEFPQLTAVFNSGWEYDARRQFDRGIRAIIAGWSTTTTQDPTTPNLPLPNTATEEHR
jgi:TetR/AcrR family tetracycline transcriptional repressor